MNERRLSRAHDLDHAEQRCVAVHALVFAGQALLLYTTEEFAA
ncbi:hypothetical protein [Sinomonas susongensis]|nr:hypothetical protein [Sinomonas susongensis]